MFSATHSMNPHSSMQKFTIHIVCRLRFKVIDAKEKVLRARLARRSKEKQKKPSKLMKNMNTNKTRKRISLIACAAALLLI